MIKHIVIFKTVQNAPLKKFKKKVEKLKKEIKEIEFIEVGLDIGFDTSSSDFCVITYVKNINDLKIYANHPKHLKVVEFIKPYIIKREVVDYKV